MSNVIINPFFFGALAPAGDILLLADASSKLLLADASCNLTLAESGNMFRFISSTVFDLDATYEASYSTTVDDQKWRNVIPFPADSASATDYDFFLGADGTSSTDDPTFNGSVGDNAAFWTFDGGDFFDLVTGSNTTLLDELHITTAGADFWVACAFNKSDATWADAIYFSTRAVSGTSADGVTLELDSNEVLQFVQRGNSATITNNSSSPSSPSGDHLFIMSYSHSSNQIRFWINTATKDEQSMTFNTTTDTPDNLRISGRGNLTAPLDSETRLYHLSMGNAYIDDAEAQLIIDELETRHARTYV